MKLKQSAQYHFTTPFDIINGLGNWETGFTGKLAPVDRFLSNFHRPLQRRMLHTKPDQVLPASGVIRNNVTGQMYLLGQSRQDDEYGEAYTQLTVCHLVSNSNSGLATLTRKTVDGARPDATIGELVDTVIGTYYMAVEYKTSIENFGTDEVFEDRFLVFAPNHIDFEPEDIITLGGVDYVINSPYHDSDFAGAIATREPDDRVTGTYRKILPSYNVTTGVVTNNYDDYLVTCTVNRYQDKTPKVLNGFNTEVEIYLKSPSFPLAPEVGDHFMVDGQDYEIAEVRQEQEAAYQWLLICSRVNS